MRIVLFTFICIFIERRLEGGTANFLKMAITSGKGSGLVAGIRSRVAFITCTGFNFYVVFVSYKMNMKKTINEKL